MCREREREREKGGSVYREIDIRECVCKEKERYGRKPVTIRVWFRIRVRVRIIWHFVLWHFVRFFIFWHFVRIRLFLYVSIFIFYLYYIIIIMCAFEYIL